MVVSNAPNESKFSSLAASGSNADSTNPLDEISAADIAVNVARVTRLPESTAVKNKADSEVAKLAVSSNDDNIISKPQVISDGLKSSKDIIHYKVQPGDTVQSVAEKFGITSETIRLSNNLEGDSLSPGMDLLISPIDGLVYRVQPGDTPQSLASRYRADANQIITFNDVEVTGRLKVGRLIVIPDGAKPVSSYYLQSGYTTGFSFGSAPIYTPNGYDYGYCTWYAAKRRAELGSPIPSNLGNAITWLSAARLAGLSTGSTPRAGAVVYFMNIGGLGHVAVVENVNSDGSFRISQMNNPYWGRVTYDTIPASEAGSYRFIY
ncbi:MAG TPA: CHAP domain-containing protein [Candidatus Saccharimonadales bacterium]|nr:CHAP domain-containing protein [Candidatus Saccharimonadales bacterium]